MCNVLYAYDTNSVPKNSKFGISNINRSVIHAFIRMPLAVFYNASSFSPAPDNGKKSLRYADAFI